MIDAIVGFAIRQRVAVIVVMLFLIGFGVWQATNLAIDAEPDVTNTQVVVSALDPTLGPEELERRVTYPLEIGLAGMYHLDHTESVSQLGLSQVTCYFDENIDIYAAREHVSERLQSMQGQLPSGVTATMDPVSTGMGEILHIRLDAPNLSLMEQRSLMDWTVRPQLMQVPGIADVNVLGGETRQYQVMVDAQRLAARGLTMRDIDSALSSNNRNRGGSYIFQGPEERIVRGIGYLQTLDDIRKVAVSSRNGTPVTISQIADVREGPAPRQGAATQDGKGECVVVIPLLRIGSNARTTIAAVMAKLKTIQADLPPGTKLVPEFDRSSLINDTLGTVEHNLLEGGALVIVILFLFLLQIRAGLIVSAIIPLSMMFAIIGMSLFNISANLLSLGAIDFGMIVDGAVIIVENSVRRLAEQRRETGEDVSDDARRDIIRKSAVEVLTPSVFGIIIILSTYTPVLTLSQVEGKLFKPMALTVMFALFGSLLLSLTLIPALCAFFLKSGEEKHNKPLEKLTDGYEKALAWAIDHRWVPVGGALAFVAVSIFFGMRLGSEFVPQLQENNIAVSVYYAPSTSIPEMIDRAGVIERYLMQKYPTEVTHVLTRIGRPQIPTDPMLQSQADIFIELAPTKHWKDAKTQDELTGKITKALDEVPGFSADYTQPIQMRMDEMIYGQGERADFAVTIHGQDMNVLRQQGDQLVTLIKSVKGAADVKAETVVGLPQLVVDIDRAAIARYGIAVSDVNDTLDSAIGGHAATMITDGDRQIDVTARLASPYRSDLQSIGRVLVPGRNGLQVPLSEVATIREVDGPVQISRENEKRRLMVTANVRGSDLGTFVKDVQQKLKAQIHLPPSYSLEYGGTYESLQSGRSRLLLVVPIALAAIFALLMIVFGQVRQAVIIFVGLPLAISGGLLALAVRGMQFSMTAAIGFIALGGIALLNGLVMMTVINNLRKQGKSVQDAAREGAKERLRPILMTATVAAFGFVPMALSQGMGAEVERPLATVVIGGLITATFLTLFVLPTLYVWLERDDDPIKDMEAQEQEGKDDLGKSDAKQDEDAEGKDGDAPQDQNANREGDDADRASRAPRRELAAPSR